MTQKKISQVLKRKFSNKFYEFRYFHDFDFLMAIIMKGL